MAGRALRDGWCLVAPLGRSACTAPPGVFLLRWRLAGCVPNVPMAVRPRGIRGGVLTHRTCTCMGRPSAHFCGGVTSGPFRPGSPMPSEQPLTWQQNPSPAEQHALQKAWCITSLRLMRWQRRPVGHSMCLLVSPGLYVAALASQQLETMQLQGCNYSACAACMRCGGTGRLQKARRQERIVR